MIFFPMVGYDSGIPIGNYPWLKLQNFYDDMTIIMDKTYISKPRENLNIDRKD